VARVLAPSLERFALSIDKTGGKIERLTRELEQIIRSNEAATPAAETPYAGPK